MFGKIVGLIGIVALVGALIACGQAEPEARMQPRQPAPAAPAQPVAQQAVAAPAQPAPAAPAAPAAEASADAVVAAMSVAPAPVAPAAPAAEAPADVVVAAMSVAPAPVAAAIAAPGAASDASAPPAPAPAREAAAPAYQPVSISAGEVDDNERWAEYIKYRDAYEGLAVHDLDVSERYIITVLDADGYPVPNAEVRIATEEAVDLFEGRTYANGQTVFFPRTSLQHSDAQEFTVHVEVDGIIQSRQFARGEDSDWNFTLDAAVETPARIPLDLLFLLDATGSMSDEIDQIKATMLSISSRISDLPSNPDLRFGMVAYRDRGDDFITRTYHFETDVQEFLNSIRDVQADGGGDEPESLNEALHVAVGEPEWRQDAIRLVFLIADAPPHLDYAQDYDYAVEMVEASRQGIKIFPIASSGLSAQGEYIFRQIAIHTMGRFLFILYGGSTPHSVGQYSVENLDDLVVELVEAELAHLSR